MAKVSDMLESKFLKQQDVGAGALLTIASCDQFNVAKQGAEPEHKWCLTFEEEDKPMVLNSTNIQLCKAIFGSDDTDDWVGKKIVLYTDPTIMYAGKVVGGIRVRKPKAQQPAAVAAAGGSSRRPVAVSAPEPAPNLTDDDIPFAWLLPFVLPVAGALSFLTA